MPSFQTTVAALRQAAPTWSLTTQQVQQLALNSHAWVTHCMYFGFQPPLNEA
jgi:hypothetical protein